MKITLSNALKLQRKVIANQKNNQRMIIKNNSYIVGSVIYKILELEEEQQNLKKDLIKLKLAIRQANNTIAEDIFTLSELKEELKRFENISTKEGTYLDMESGKTVIHAVHLDTKIIKKKLGDLVLAKREIENILDSHNKETEITLDFKSNLLNNTA